MKGFLFQILYNGHFSNKMAVESRLDYRIVYAITEEIALYKLKDILNENGINPDDLHIICKTYL